MLKKVGSMPLLVAVALFAATTLPRVAVAVDRSCGGMFQPVYIVVDHPVPKSAQHLSMDAVRRAIMAAGAQRQWLFEAAGPGELLATQTARGWMVKVKVSYSQTAYSIRLVDTNLERSADLIHGKYNQWVRNLEKDIEVRLAVEGVQSN